MTEKYSQIFLTEEEIKKLDSSVEDIEKYKIKKFESRKRERDSDDCYGELNEDENNEKKRKLTVPESSTSKDNIESEVVTEEIEIKPKIKAPKKQSEPVVNPISTFSFNREALVNFVISTFTDQLNDLRTALSTNGNNTLEDYKEIIGNISIDKMKTGRRLKYLVLFCLKNLFEKIPPNEIITYTRRRRLKNFLFEKYQTGFLNSFKQFNINFFSAATNLESHFKTNMALCEKLRSKFEKKFFLLLLDELSCPNKFVQIQIRNVEGEVEFYTVKEKAKLGEIFDSYSKQTKLCSLKFVDAGMRLDSDASPYDLDLDDNVVIDVFKPQCGGKPMILLYPNVDEYKVNLLKLKLNERFWGVHTFYPKTKINEEKSIVEWENFCVDRKGVITFANEMKFKYLFWEALTKKDIRFDFDVKKNIFVVPRNEISNFLYKVLSIKGLKDHDIHDMITYWLGELEEFPYNLIQFMSEVEYDKLVNIEISPKPSGEVVHVKIFLLFKGFNDLKDVKDVKDANIVKDLSLIEEEKLKDDVKGKFLICEWGGMNLRKSSFVK